MTYTSLLSKHLAFICKYTSKAFNQLISTTSSTSEATDVTEEEELHRGITSNFVSGLWWLASQLRKKSLIISLYIENL